MPVFAMQQLFRNAEHHEQLSRSPLWRRVELAYHATAGSAGLDVVFSHTSGRCSWSKVSLHMFPSMRAILNGELELQLKTSTLL